MTTTPITLDGSSLTVDDVVRAARSFDPVVLTKAAESAIATGHATFEAHAKSGVRIYGYTTGVGALDQAPLSPEDNRAFQRHLLRSHAAGVGAPMSFERVRAMLVVRANTLAKGRSGISLATVNALLALIEQRVHPFVPEIGSVGASDLAPLAHAALLLAGEGTAVDDDMRIPGAEAMKRAGIALPDLAGRDAFALVNGTSQTLGTGALAIFDADRLVRLTEVAAAMTMVAVSSRDDFLNPDLVGTEKERGAEIVASAASLRALVGYGSGPASEAVREPLSTRCAPQVFGATRGAVARARAALELDLNARIDNPSLLPDGTLSNNAGTMHAQAVAEALDALVTSVTSLASMSERRTARLLDPSRNGGHPAFLVHPAAKAGLNSGLMIAQYTAAALVAELRAGASPGSIQSIPVCNGTEDHGSMSALSARRAAWAVELAEIVVAIELLTATQALDLRFGDAIGAHTLTPGLYTRWRAIRDVVPVLVDDRVLSDDIEAIVVLLRRDRLG
jgi:histidine ammonia-lyase